MTQHKYLLLLFSFLFCFTAWGSGIKERYGMIIDNREHYFYRALEYNLISQSTENTYDIAIQDKTDGLDESTIINNYLNKHYFVIILAPASTHIIQESNDILIEKDSLVHILDNGDLIANKFIGGLVLFQTIPKQFTMPTIPWVFVGMDVDAIANIYIQAIAASDHAIPKGEIAVLLPEQQSLLFQQIYLALESIHNTNNTIQLHIIPPTFSRADSYIYVHDTFLNNNSIVAIITFNDEVAIGAGQAYNNDTSSAHRPIIIGFGGSKEAKQAIKNHSITMTIAPDYKQYATSLLAAADSVYQESNRLIAQNNKKEIFTTPKEPLSKTVIPFSVITAEEYQTAIQ